MRNNAREPNQTGAQLANTAGGNYYKKARKR